MKAWKLTGEKDQTHGLTQWGEGVTHEIATPGKRMPLCSPGWIHYYRHPVLAVILNPVHAAFNAGTMHLWECEAEGEHLHEGWLKSGCTKLTTLRRIPLPEVSDEKQVEFVIRCVMRCLNPNRAIKSSWELWAEAWLDGSDRTAYAAYAAARAAYAADAAARAAYAAARAAYAAVYVADAAVYAAYAADAAYDAVCAVASTAAYAARTVPDMDLVSVLRECGLCE